MTITTFDQKIAEFFNSLETNGWYWGNLLACFIAVLLCLFLVGMIGYEREARGRSAGLRTHLLVGLGSCILMILSIYGFPASAPNRDVARLAAGVITGVGFLGAGAIIHNNAGIKGLTTAGTIWISMAIGMACGSFNFVIALFTGVIVIVVLTLFRKIEEHITKHKNVLSIIAPIENHVMSQIVLIAQKHECTVGNIVTDTILDGGNNCIQITFSITSKNNTELSISEIVAELKEATGALSINILNAH